MLSILCNNWNQTNRQFILCGAILAICCYFETSKIAFAQHNPRTATYQTTNQARQAVSPARQVVVAEPMKPVPDFWANYSDQEALLIAHDRLNRKNLPMLYHFSFDQYHRADLSVAPGVPTVPEPQYRNNPNDLESRLRVLRESTEGGNKALAPTTPSPLASSPDDSQQPSAVKIRRLPGVQGIVAIGDL